MSFTFTKPSRNIGISARKSKMFFVIQNIDLSSRPTIKRKRKHLSASVGVYLSTDRLYNEAYQAGATGTVIGRETIFL